ncbi:hypothetical protein M5W83_17610 [Paenibacillus thiaminolyticus]|uniref:Uncharacterized protein n=1 Tax=Paenibacillus thiaminolyticus TaxID=49283 RepID=A0AAP9J0N6_PANTH|nr:hypothetical protein [Paenibacillus thiaminolyticus]MCY9536560.1 hypothetical protein [Paenibacillus thiaminolyticus]MCY9601539.1 hypothetical protein [Paenibacillus thiaminolyticus]MCY9608963.1 hypothetical protein [Paenibacillus thiaminolyticus]MCY9612164.1 hypothetical protein [Paenibacillus thiaminolyticus]MCY9619599.1 hypothetical protein [Paenibacillus thiaminolyticus]
MMLTVSSGRQGQEWFDIDVSEDCTGLQLKSILGLKLFGEPPRNDVQYILEAKQPEGLWFVVQEQQRLAEAGLREGAHIRIQRAYSTTTDSLPAYGRRMLFQPEKDRVANK